MQYAWAQRFGVDVFVCSWFGPGGYNDLTIRDHLLPSPARGPTRISILYESLQRMGSGPDARIHLDAANTATILSDFAYLARTYFNDPGYYRIDGRPVVTIYATRIFRGDVAGLVASLREVVESATGMNPYLIGDEVDWDSVPDPSRIALFDAITGYTLYSRTQPAGWPSTTHILARIQRHVRSYAQVAADEGVGFIPDAMPGFNDRGFRPADRHHVLPPAVRRGGAATSLFAASLTAAGMLVDPLLGVLAVTSWNEWHEDTQIEPTAPGRPGTSAPAAITQGFRYVPYGFSLLNTLSAFKARWQAGP